MKTKIIKKGLPGWISQAWLVEFNGKYFVVSGVSALFTGWEVLVFESDKNGEVKNMQEIAGGRGITHEQAIEDLERRLTS
jgi:hypothetical protein